MSNQYIPYSCKCITKKKQKHAQQGELKKGAKMTKKERKVKEVLCDFGKRGIFFDPYGRKLRTGSWSVRLSGGFACKGL